MATLTGDALSRPVLVTGACGRLGAQVVRRLVESGRRVLATDRVPELADQDKFWGANSPDKIEFAQADLTDLAAVEALAARCGDVVHVAAVPGPSSTPPPGVDGTWSEKAIIGLEDLTGLELLRQNLLGTCGLFEAVAKQPGARRIVFSSSLFSMGWSHDPADFAARYLPLDEEHPPLSLEHYGLSKALAEDFAQMLARVGNGGEPPAKRARVAGSRASFVLLRFSNIIKADRWSELPWPPPAEPVTPLMWAYTHEHDVVDLHVKALEVPQERLPSSCETFLVAADDTRYDATTEALIAQHWPGGSPPLRRPLPGHSSLVNCEKAKRLLGFAPRSFRIPAPSTSPAVEAVPSGSTFEVPSVFRLVNGEALEGGFLVYQTYGKLNADKSNVILHPTSFDAVHKELEFNVGPGKMLDTNRYFVIIVNLLGNGVSFSPSSRPAGHLFPARGVSMGDNVRLQAMLLDSLGITRLTLIYGYSMGAMQALHWAVMYPERVDRVAAVCGAARASDFNVTFLDSLRAALLADPSCQEGHSGRVHLVGPCALGLKAFARIYAGWGMSMEFYRQELWRDSSRDGKPFESREDFVTRSYEGGFAGSHPLNLLAQIDTWRAADVSKAPGLPANATLADTLKRIRARVYMMPSATDQYFTVPEIRGEAELIPNCRCVPLDSAWGHRAGDPHRPGQEADARALATLVGELLAE